MRRGVCAQREAVSGATAVQIVWSSRRDARQIEHLSSTHDEGQLEVLKAAADQCLAASQQSLDWGWIGSAARRP